MLICVLPSVLDFMLCECTATFFEEHWDALSSMVVATPNCSVVWRLHNHSAFALVQQNPGTPLISISSSSSSWTKICDNVASLSLSQDTGWIVKLDGLVCHTVRQQCLHLILLHLISGSGRRKVGQGAAQAALFRPLSRCRSPVGAAAAGC